jgi:hypothetical protein
MSDLRLLAVVPDSNAAVKLRHIARYNPDCQWQCITVRDDAVGQLYDWVNHFGGVHHLAIRDRWVVEGEVECGPNPYNSSLIYEAEVACLNVPMVSKFWQYSLALRDLAVVLSSMLSEWALYDYDAMVIWGERCWYNEMAKRWAHCRGLPVIFVERAAFPGMFIVDGTGLSDGCSDLEWYEGARAPEGEFQPWLSAMTLQGIEQQRPTTPAQVREVIPIGRTIFVPLQMPFDTNMVFRTEGGINTNEALLEWVAKHRPGQRVVVKRHPSDWFTDEARLVAKCAELGFTLVDFAVHPLLEQVQEVVTINSQTGVEAWMHGVDVTWLGKPGFMLEGLQPEEMLQVLRWGYYVEASRFGERVREILARKKVTDGGGEAEGGTT